MSEKPKRSLPSMDHGQFRPDHFVFYTREVVELLSEDTMPATSRSSELPGKTSGGVRGKHTIDTSSSGTISSFRNSIEAGLSNFEKERLRSLLRQGVFDLTPEVDEMLDPVISMCKLQFEIRNRKGSSNGNGEVSEGDAEPAPRKKLKTSSCSSAIPLRHGSCNEVDNDLQILLESESSLVEETVKKYSDKLSARLAHMERQLEELLNAVMSRCRPMTRPEKQELRKLVQKLPHKNLDRVVEIVQHSKLADSRTSDEYFVDLENEDNVTLWRLYYYVKAVEKARELLL